jgi:hypothetical protein
MFHFGQGGDGQDREPGEDEPHTGLAVVADASNVLVVEPSLTYDFAGGFPAVTAPGWRRTSSRAALCPVFVAR